jgi:hypothetical protein
MIHRTTKTTNRVNYKGKLRLKTGKLQMEAQHGREYDWRKIEELLQPSTRIRKLHWIWQTATSQPIIEYLGKRMVHNMMTEMTELLIHSIDVEYYDCRN